MPEALLLEAGVVVDYYHLDTLGSVRAGTDESGQVVRRHDYFPFGEEVNAQPGGDARRFTGKERDAETAFDYFGARYYCNTWGRFATVDPGHVGGNVFDPQSWNAYAYARNNPLRFVDPSGTDYFVDLDEGNGADFWFDSGSGTFGEFEKFASPFVLRGGPWKGTVYRVINGVEQPVGTYQYADKVVHLASAITTRTAGVVEAVGVAVDITQVALAIAFPVASTAANCAVGNCRLSGVGLAMALSPKAVQKLGTLAPLATRTVADAIRLRGGTGKTVNRVASWLRQMSLAEAAERAVSGDREAETALKLVKQAAKKAER